MRMVAVLRCATDRGDCSSLVIPYSPIVFMHGIFTYMNGLNLWHSCTVGKYTNRPMGLIGYDKVDGSEIQLCSPTGKSKALPK